MKELLKSGINRGNSCGGGGSGSGGGNVDEVVELIDLSANVGTWVPGVPGAAGTAAPRTLLQCQIQGLLTKEKTVEVQRETV